MMRRRSADPVDRTIWALAIPALGSLAIEPLYATADTIIIGRLGTAELAGLAIAAQILTVIVALSNFLAYGTTQRLATARGAGDQVQAARVGVQAMWVGVTLGLAIAAVVAMMGPGLASALGARNEVLEVASTYLVIRAVGLPVMLVALVANGVLRGVRDLVTPLRIIAAAALGNVIIEVVMVFGFGWGVAGAAWSTVIVQWIAGLVYLRVVMPHLLGTGLWPNRLEIFGLLSAGRWLIVRTATLLAALTIATAVAARDSAATLAAHQIVSVVFMITALSLDALAIPAQTLVAEAIGARDVAAARQIAARVLRAARRAAVVVAVLVAISAPWLPAAFSSDGDVERQAQLGLLMLAVVLLPGAAAFALDGILIGAGAYRALSWAMVLALMVFIVVIVPVAVVGTWGLAGIWAALAAWMTVRAWLTWRAWSGRQWIDGGLAESDPA